tara:strand:- start:341 stop:1237 length:897 start_codon:yes stop_codon:yes gene_type:complete
MDVSIVIVSYNVREYIISCIQSIYKHSNSGVNFEIIVIDNDSKDNSVDELNKTFPEINLIQNNYNAGYTVAANQGSKVCKGEYIFFLNPDTLFIEDSLGKLIGISDKQINLGIVGPKLITSDGFTQQSYWKKPSVPNTILSLIHLDYFNFYKNYNNTNLNEIIEVDSLSGGALFLKKEIFEELGGFNEKLFWMEDIDFSIRLNSNGYFNFYYPLTEIIHFKGKSSESNYKVAISNQLLSKIKFFKIHHSQLGYYMIFFSVLFVSLIKSILMLPIAVISSKYREKMLAYIYTIKSALRS